jgi:hypothetical protein
VGSVEVRFRVCICSGAGLGDLVVFIVSVSVLVSTSTAIVKKTMKQTYTVQPRLYEFHRACLISSWYKYRED